jgi:hypothetical protein
MGGYFDTRIVYCTYWLGKFPVSVIRKS